MKKSPENIQSARQILNKHWGYQTFRPLQEEIIQTVLAQKNLLALMPTGGGKSICYQVPALLQPGLTLVISPLIALMQDQVQQLRARHIKAEAIYSGMDTQEISNILDHCLHGSVKLLYLSPERLQTKTFLERLPHMNISLLAIDEAHCISQWGYDFRPAYLKIPLFKAQLSKIPTIAVTATATAKVQKDILEKLEIKKATILKKSFARENLAYVVRKSPNKKKTLLHILKKVKGSAIVYGGKRATTEQLANILCQHGIAADYYHAGLKSTERKKKQEAWLKDAKRVIVATNAFGMGIDKPNVRLVIHYVAPTTLEAYYQEAGRAGRDEKKAYAVLLYNQADIKQIVEIVKKGFLTIDYLKSIYQQLANYYQVAIGSHAGISYPLDLEHFAITYNLSLQRVKKAIRQLEIAGLASFDSQGARPSQLHIKLDQGQLYTFRLANPTADQLFKKLLTTYGVKLFKQLTPISLERIAHLMQSSPPILEKQCKYLVSLDIITYKPPQKKAQFTFLTPRYPADKIPLDQPLLLARKKLLTEKTQALIHYITHEHRCRTQLLLEYFGEITYVPCHVCDICTKKKTTNQQQEKTLAKNQKEIITHLEKKPCTIDLLIDKMAEKNIKNISDAIRTLLEQGQVTYQGNGKITLKKL